MSSDLFVFSQRPKRPNYSPGLLTVDDVSKFPQLWNKTIPGVDYPEYLYVYQVKLPIDVEPVKDGEFYRIDDISLSLIHI